jgi:multicomponent Na+:H+ antiporter subunit E
VSLLPGTLSADLNQDRLTLHVLDLEAPVIRELQQIEDLVAGLYAPARAAVSGTRDDHG